MSRYLSPGTMTILILAILVGLVAAYAIRGAMAPQAPTLPQAPETALMPLASAELPSGRMIVDDDMVLVPMTKEQMDGQKWGKSLMTVMRSPEQIIGRRLRNPVSQGSPFMTTDFYLWGRGPSLDESLRPGNRAISVQVPFERGGYVTIGTTVDVIFQTTPRPGDENTPPVPEKTIVLVENANVIAVEEPTTAPANTVVRPDKTIDLRLSNRSSGSALTTATVVLGVTLEQANKIEAVRKHGEFTLLTRPPGETNFAGPPPPTSFADVLGLQALLPEEPALPAVTEIYRRGQRQVNAFQFTGGRYVPAAAYSNQ